MLDMLFEKLFGRSDVSASFRTRPFHQQLCWWIRHNKLAIGMNTMWIAFVILLLDNNTTSTNVLTVVLTVLIMPTTMIGLATLVQVVRPQINAEEKILEAIKDGIMQETVVPSRWYQRKVRCLQVANIFDLFAKKSEGTSGIDLSTYARLVTDSHETLTFYFPHAGEVKVPLLSDYSSTE